MSSVYKWSTYIPDVIIFEILYREQYCTSIP
jgi:hypothetical protein